MVLRMEHDGAGTKNLSDFSIDHILNRAGCTRNTVKEEESESCASRGDDNENQFSWLHCTRFCPPKIPRHSKKEIPQKRQLGRYPRIPFTNEQLAILEEKFQESSYLSSEEAANLSRRLQLADVKVKIWFQNRRARKRREEMGDNRNERQTVKREVTDSKDFLSEASTSSGFIQSTSAVPYIYITPQTILDYGPR